MIVHEAHVSTTSGVTWSMLQTTSSPARKTSGGPGIICIVMFGKMTFLSPVDSTIVQFLASFDTMTASPDAWVTT